MGPVGPGGVREAALRGGPRGRAGSAVSRRPGASALLLAPALLCLAGGPAAAQEIRFTPQPGSPAQRTLARFLAQERYVIWTRDTVLARGDTVVGNVLVLEAAARLAGTVRGSVYVVDGDLFLRPGSRIGGDVLALGGGFYSSGLAEVEGTVTYRPNEVLRVIPEDGAYRIFAVEDRPRAFELEGVYGLRLPTYQRVDGWTFEWGARARAVGFPGQPELGGRLRFKTTGDRFEGSLRHLWHPTAALRVGVEAGRETRSNDAWIRSDFTNTGSFLFLGNDYRNYYRADHAAFVLLLEGPTGWSASFSAGWEEALSLEARDRTILFRGDVVRPNPPVDDGDTYSLSAVVDFEERTPTTRRNLHLHLEGASRDVAGDFSFLMGEAQLFLRQPVAAGHAIEVRAMGRGDLAGSLPQQRWSAIGGIGTFPTFSILELRGERMLLGELGYLIPIPVLEIPQVGPTEVLLRGTVGSAWSEGETLDLESNLTVGIRILFLEGALAVNPGRSDLDPQLYVTGRFPRTLKGF